MQQQNIPLQQIQRNITNNQKIQQSLNKHLNDTPTAKDPIQQAIHNIVAPIKTQIQKDVLTQQTSIQVFKSFSIMGFISKTYQQVLVYLLQQSQKTFYDQKGNALPPSDMREQILSCLNQPEVSIQLRICSLIKVIKNQNRRNVVKRMIVTKLFQSMQQILKKTNYQIYISDILKLMFNPYSVPFQFNSPQIVQQRHSFIINKKLLQSKNASDYNNVTNKQITVILKSLYKQNIYKQQNKDHWKQIDENSDLKIQNKTRQRFLQQASVLQTYQEKIQGGRESVIKMVSKEVQQQNQKIEDIIKKSKIKASVR